MKHQRSVCIAAVACLMGAQALCPADVGTAFTYQGYLEKPPGTPVDDTCNFRFGLWNSEAGGFPKGNSPQIINAIDVSSGVFVIASLDFGAGAFDGWTRWLAIEVQCTGDANYVPLSPRVELKPTPYALALPGLYTQQNGNESPNVIGGWSLNNVTATAAGATIAGGGTSAYPNRVTDWYGTVGGGTGNQAGDNAGTVSDAAYATVGGGHQNIAEAGATVAGGYQNAASGNYSTVGGGYNNEATLTFATVAGGDHNTANDIYAYVGGGSYNSAAGEGSAIGGGQGNTASEYSSHVGGGSNNSATGDRSAVSGGSGNAASAQFSTIGGGRDNEASDWAATVAGGDGNVANGYASSVGGGTLNTATGVSAVVPGGQWNVAGGHGSFAAGTGAKVRTPAQVGGGDTLGDYGTFIWADRSVGLDVTSTGPNQFLVRAAGGIWLGTTSSPSIPAGRFLNTSTGGYLTTGGVWTNASDRNKKENVVPVDPAEVLERVVSVPISRWNYREESDTVRHIGPMAQDFHAAFGLGDSDKAIATVDADGVALSAIQGLYQLVQEADCQLAELRQERDDLARHSRELEDRLRSLEALTANLANRKGGE